jgi:CRP/FNR family transcriptional regulator, cyclic AMP receptor protein
MTRKVVESLKRVDVFKNLSESELIEVATLCRVWNVPENHIIFREGDDGDELFIIQQGCVRVSINTRGGDGTVGPATINMLYAGQSFGEMVLLDGSTRSATITSAEDCVLLMLKDTDFATLCESNPRIGYSVMRSLASDLAYKLRSSNLLLRGNIRWQRGELGRR